MYLKENPARDPTVPGPGQYTIPQAVGAEAAKYSMRPRTCDPCKNCLITNSLSSILDN